jgi:glycosyltransferase involved in cell wall biosynthesis
MGGQFPRVSIGMPVYNGERYIEQAIESILAQTFSDFELIISDNASTDRTADICRSYAVRDRRIRYCRNETNIGYGRNQNLVIELSSGEYFLCAHHDDVRAPQCLERFLEIHEKNPTVVLSYT